MRNKIANIIGNEIAQKKPLIYYLNNTIISDEAQKLKAEDPATFCKLLAFYEETKRYKEEISKIAETLVVSDEP